MGIHEICSGPQEHVEELAIEEERLEKGPYRFRRSSSDNHVEWYQPVVAYVFSPVYLHLH